MDGHDAEALLEPDAEPFTDPTPELVLVAETPPPRVCEPPVLFKMKGAHRPEHWLFIRLVPKDTITVTDTASMTSQDAAQAYCLKCRALIPYSVGQTNGVTRHMETFHLGVLRQHQRRRSEVSQGKLTNKFAATASDSTPSTSTTITKDQQKKANQMLAQWLAKSQRPFSLVEDPGFRAYVDFITNGVGGSKVAVPSRTLVTDDVKQFAVQMRATLKGKIRESCSYYCVTTDLWTDKSMRSFMAVTLHYLDSSFRMNDWTIEVEAFSGKHTGVAIAAALSRTLNRWDLDKSMCVRLVRDGASNAVSAAAQLDIPHASCIAHSLHLVVAGAMIKRKKRNNRAGDETAANGGIDFELDEDNIARVDDIAHDDGGDFDADVERLREIACDEIDTHLGLSLATQEQAAMNTMRASVQVFRSLAVYLRKSSKAKHRFLQLRDVYQRGCGLWISTDCPTRWSSCADMLRRFVKLETTVDRFFTYLATREGQQEFERVRLQRPSAPQWLAIKFLLSLLGPFSAVTQHLSGSRYSTLTLALPMLRHIKKKLSNPDIYREGLSLLGDRGGEYVSSVLDQMHRVRTAMLALFTARFDNLGAELLWIPYLNPLTVDMAHLDPNELVEAHQMLIAAAVDIGRQQHSPPRADSPPVATTASMTSPEKWILDMFDDTFGPKAKRARGCDSEVIDTAAALKSASESEFVLYLKDAKMTTLKQDPLEWWNTRSTQYPVLSQLARKWLCCVATSVPSERAFSTAGNIVTVKRCSLDPSTVRDTVFIAENT